MPTLFEAIAYWLKLGLISFGGPAGQIAIMHRHLVEQKRWISEKHFLHALNFCMLLPGPEAQQLAIYLGWRLHGWRGGIAAGTLFVLPSALILFVLSWLYMAGGHISALSAIFYGLLPAVIAVILSALIRIGGKTLHSASLWGIAILSFIGIFFFNVSFILIVLGAAIIGLAGHRLAPQQFVSKSSHGSANEEDEEGCLILLPSPKPSWRRSLWIFTICIFLWFIPIVSLGIWQGWGSTLIALGFFFTKAALVTLGGAYAVLPYVAQQAVENYGWLTHSQMMSGLALAETTPGPLIMVLQFVGFVSGWQNAGQLSPWAAASIGAAITTWVTFIPSFLFVFLGAPYVQGLRDFPKINAALTAISGAVVGVILNLAVEFSTHAIWKKTGDIDYFVIIGAVAALLALWRFKMPFFLVMSCSASLSLFLTWLK